MLESKIIGMLLDVINYFRLLASSKPADELKIAYIGCRLCVAHELPRILMQS